MLQRIQTIYLFISFLAAVLLMFFPISSFQSIDLVQQYKLYIGGLKPVLENAPNTIVLLVLTSLLGILTLYSIFKFKNRPLQIKINSASLFVNMGLLVAIFYYSEEISGFETIKKDTPYLLAAYFPVVSVLTIILANRAIRSDEKMLKKSNRLR